MRYRAPLLLCVVALLLLAACTVPGDERYLEANIVRPTNFKAGSGVIQAAGVLRGDPNLYRLTIYMDAGLGHQTVDVDSDRFGIGEAVELTSDGRVVKVTGTTLNQAIRP